jgi:hypothetical protein
MVSPNPSRGRAKKRVEPETTSKTENTSRLRRGILTASASIVAAAVVTAIATALITPDRLNTLLGFTSPSTPTATPKAHPIQYKEVRDDTGAISLSIPSGWAYIQGNYNVAYDKVIDKGVALNAGTNPQHGTAYGVDGVYVGVSVDTATRLGMADWSPSRLIAWETNQDDLYTYSPDGCILTTKQVPARAGWVIASRVWDDCEGEPGFSVYELVGTPPDRSYVVNMEERSDNRTASAVFEHVALSIAIQPNLVPHSLRPDFIIPLKSEP